jgi:hypothetical protein
VRFLARILMEWIPVTQNIEDALGARIEIKGIELEFKEVAI